MTSAVCCTCQWFYRHHDQCSGCTSSDALFLSVLRFGTVSACDWSHQTVLINMLTVALCCCHQVFYGTWHCRPVAIKLLRPDSSDSSRLMDEFHREVRTMCSLPDHPNVLQLIGVCTEPPSIALVTEYCAKGSLYGVLHAPGAYLSWAEVLFMLIGAAKGMAHLHNCRIVHR